jgi:hypothetical protein
MRRLLFSTAAGALLVPLLGLAYAADPPAKPLKSPPPTGLVEKDQPDATMCGSHGTKVDFVDTPKEAAAQAKKEQKLVFVLHVSGNFEDPRFT